jgi:hypothetical protein
MARRDGWAACVMGLHLCVLAGCLHTGTPPPPEPADPPAAGTAGRPDTRSPYAVRTTDVPAGDRTRAAELSKPPADTEFKQASQPQAEKPGAPEQAPPPQAPQPLPTISAAGPDRPTADPVATQTAKESSEPPLLTALRLVLAKNPSEAIDALQAYDKQTQEILLALLPVVARLSEAGLDRASPQEITALLDQLNSLANLLRGRSALGLDKACFARRIDGFGQYDTLAANPVFMAGTDGPHADRARVYAEVRNFLSKFNGKSYEINLTGRLEIYDGDGQWRWGRDVRDAQPMYSLSPRQDVFVSFRFSPPANLRPGNYVLVVEVHDESVPAPDAKPRVARCKLPFRIGEPARPGER